MSAMKIQFISKGFREILYSGGTQGVVEDAAKQIQQKANSAIGEESTGFRVSVWRAGFGGGRWAASVTATDAASMRAESEKKALSKAVSK